MHTVCVIPARHASQRFPGKPLKMLLGRPMIQWVVETARALKGVDEVLVATDHPEIAAAASRMGVEAIMTDPALPSGTDRVNAALLGRRGDIVVNLQGDEPLMPGEAVSAALASLLRTNADVATACVPILRREEFEAGHVVKVVRDANDRALYFSRSPIPSLYRRDEPEMTGKNYIFGYKHLGLYILTRSALERFCRLSPSSLEKMEKLEQLRLMENGMTIQCVESPRDSVGVDVPEDVPRVEALLQEMGRA